jgi:hypothetical protein
LPHPDAGTRQEQADPQAAEATAKQKSKVASVVPASTAAPKGEEHPAPATPVWDEDLLEAMRKLGDQSTQLSDLVDQILADRHDQHTHS